MQKDLTQLLRAQPFVPFSIILNDRRVLSVTGVEVVSAGKNVFTFVDRLEGYIALIPYQSIQQINTKDAPTIL